MGSASSGATNVAKVAKRSQLVALRDWVTEEGDPVQVLCTEIGGEAAARITGVLPGERPKVGFDNGATPEELEKQADRLLEIGPDLIELGTAFAGPEDEVRPAFHFGGTMNPAHPLSLDGRKLSEPDLILLTISVLRVNGYAGGAAEASFRRRDRIRLGHGNGAVELLLRDQEDAATGPA